jgi:hypothetical protein
MREIAEVEAGVLWSREGDAWAGIPAMGSPNHGGRQDFQVELLLRATDWHVEMSHVLRGAFEREYIQAADAEDAKARAANLLLAFRAKIGGAAAV